MCWCGAEPCRDTAAEFWARHDADPDEFLRIDKATRVTHERTMRTLFHVFPPEEET